MKKVFLLWLFLMVSVWEIRAQTTDSIFWKNMALEVANDLELTFKEHDYKRYAKLNHPKIVAMIGSEDDFARFMQEQMQEIESEVKIDSIDFGIPYNFVKCDSTINCLLPQTMTMRLADTMAISSTVYLLGVSNDNGNTWYFIDGTNGAEYLDMIAPNRCKNFIIPNREEVFKTVKKK